MLLRTSRPIQPGRTFRHVPAAIESDRMTRRPAEAPRPTRPHRCCSVARRWPGARRRGRSCPRWAVGRILAPASALPPSASPRCAGRHAVAGALWGASLRVSAGLPGWCVGCAVAGSFSLVSSRAVVVPRGPLPLLAPWWRRLVGSALAAGACRWRLRASARSFSAAVVVVGFSSPARASAFAAAWSGWVGFPLAVRRFAGRAGPVWGVSVPVAVSPSLRLAAPGALPAPVAWARAA